ncbi:hypothetical protein FRC01_008388 [Tulasnella sp. 417]|nr:hypothetical protein FRC01_008388 [Tulasnella sp. 417]
MNKALARKEKIGNSQMKPEEIAEVNEYPELFETPALQRLDGRNAPTINEPPPPFASYRGDQDKKGVDETGMTKPGSEKEPPVDRDGWKQGTVVEPTMPEPVYTQASNSDPQKDPGEKAPFKLF